jgi:hypothetical protein
MDAEYTLTEDDFLKLHLHAETVIPALRWRYRMFRWGIPVGAVIYGIGFTAMVFKGPSSLSDKILGLIFLGMALLLLAGAHKLHVSLNRWSVRTQMRARQHSLLSEPLRMMLLPDQVYITTRTSHSSYKWGAILNITESPTHFFFWISQRDALIIPKRAFATPEEARLFGETARYYRDPHSLTQLPQLPR